MKQKKLLKRLVRLKALLPKFLSAFSLALPFFASPFSVAFSAPAVVPVGASLVAELLVALGVITGSASAGYVFSQNDNPYVESIFESQIGTISADVPVSEETLESTFGSIIPEGVYETDGENFYIGGKPVTPADLYLNADSLVGVSYSLPTNFAGYTLSDALAQEKAGSHNYYMSWNVIDSYVGTDTYLFPVYVTNNSKFISNYGVNIISKTSSFNVFYVPSGQIIPYTVNKSMRKYLQVPAYNSSAKTLRWYTSSNIETNISGSQSTVILALDGHNFEFVPFSGSGSLVSADIIASQFLYTDGLPKMSVGGVASDLTGALVQVKEAKTDDDDNNGGSTPPVPQSPNDWQIWRNVGDLLDGLVNGTVTNGGTTFDQYVNNNYNYVDVDINVPDNINVGLSGGLDINGKGDVNITIHEDVSLPSAGDGSGFFNPDAVNVIGALSKDNPVMGTLSGLFSVLDPALVGIVSISISLLLVLGLWKLIRG